MWQKMAENNRKVVEDGKKGGRKWQKASWRRDTRRSRLDIADIIDIIYIADIVNPTRYC